MKSAAKINIRELQQSAKASANSETFLPLDKTKYWRIGVGARATSAPASFFVEVVVNLAGESKRVDLLRLKKILCLLKEIEARGYSLSFESDNCISCETVTDSTKIEQEYTAIKTILKNGEEPLCQRMQKSSA